MNLELKNKMAQGFVSLPIDFDKEYKALERASLPSIEPIVLENDPLLKIIYGVNEDTGLPRGDYALYLSDKTSPEVRNYIQKNLLSENAVSTLSASNDNEILPFIRESYETRDEYVKRISDYVRKDLRGRLNSDNK